MVIDAPTRPVGVLNDAVESSVSAVSWSAVFAGAAVAIATSLALLALGSGIGLTSVSPWSNSGVSATTFGILAAAWLIAVQLFSCGVGGYIAGRLRTQWTGVHTDEVFFRDTAHGFLVWSVAAVVGTVIVASAITSTLSKAADVGATAASGVASGAASAAAQLAPNVQDPTAYFTDMLFRAPTAPNASDGEASRSEVSRIVTRSIASGDLSADDRAYVAQVIAARTGIPAAEAEKRVDDVVAKAKAAAAEAETTARAAADAARKAAVYVSLWIFVSLLIGAFSATYMATVGGRIRDGLPATGT